MSKNFERGFSSLKYPKKVIRNYAKRFYLFWLVDDVNLANVL